MVVLAASAFFAWVLTFVRQAVKVWKRSRVLLFGAIAAARQCRDRLQAPSLLMFTDSYDLS
ncbi:MAG: hypothetical protein VKJ09_09180 [Leptolyngbya sp.]|nr:hypothetical protein [Leptolyngbya sp.]